LSCLIARSSPDSAGRAICERARAFNWQLSYWVMVLMSRLKIPFRLHCGALGRGWPISKKQCGLRSAGLVIETQRARLPEEWWRFTADLKAFLLNGSVVESPCRSGVLQTNSRLARKASIQKLGF